MKKFFSIMSNLQTHYHFKLDFPKVDQAPQEQSVVKPSPSREYKQDIMESEDNMFNPIFKDNI